MTVHIKGRHLKVTKEIREYIESKLPRIEKYAVRNQTIEFVLEKDSYQHRADVMLKDGSLDVKAGTKDANLMRAIDLLVDKVEAQLKKKKAKIRGLTKRRELPAKRHGSVIHDEAGERAGRAKPRKSARGRAAAAQPLTIEDAGVKVFPGRSIAAPRLTVEAAAKALKAQDDGFLYFLESRTGQPHIMFRREDGAFGLAVPETTG